MKMTTKRKAILNALKASGELNSAADLHEQLPDIDLVTIYRNLELFATEGLITRVATKENQGLYEYQKTPHDHAVCTDCGRVWHVDLSKNIQSKSIKGFVADEVEVVLRGKCTTHKK